MGDARGRNPAGFFMSFRHLFGGRPEKSDDEERPVSVAQFVRAGLFF
jgi:hypothetical protein